MTFSATSEVASVSPKRAPTPTVELGFLRLTAVFIVIIASEAALLTLVTVLVAEASDRVPVRCCVPDR